MIFTLEGRIAGFRGLAFQRPEAQLSDRLSDILTRPLPNVLIGFNNAFLREDEYRVVLDYERTPKPYAGFLSLCRAKDVGLLERSAARRQYEGYFEAIHGGSTHERLGDATCFNLCYYWEEYRDGRIGEITDLYRRFFMGKRVLFVAPEQPLMGSSFRDLVKRGVILSPSDIRFLPIPNCDSFALADQILKTILSGGSWDTVFLQAGPAATVLAAELGGKHAIRAFDVGSMNVSLEKAYQVHRITF